MKRSMLAIVIGALVLAGCASPNRLPLPSSVDPVPSAWSPPKTALPADFINAVAFTLKHGLGDPRGGEYRAAEIRFRGAWDPVAKPFPVHGWVLAGNRLVCWNGLVYTPLSVGAKEDVRKDVTAALARVGVQGLGLRIQRRLPDLGDPRRPVAIALMLLAGEVDLAEKCFSGSQKDPRMVAFEYQATRIDRAVNAHASGDDELAYRDALSIQKNRQAFASASPSSPVPRMPTGEQKPYDAVDALISDSARRLQAGPKKVDLKQIAGLSQAERISHLIDDLDEVSARQMDEPGGVDPQNDPIVEALMKEGDAAVEPLIDTYENDNRLTRSVIVGHGYYLLPVKEAAYSAIRGILQLDRIGSSPTPTAEELRAFWKQNKGTTAADRWFGILANDGANDQQWLEAAQRITDPTNLRRSGFMSTTQPPEPGEVVKMRGEPLRSRANPSVSDLMAKRVACLSSSSTSGISGNEALRLSLFLAKWDAKSALPSLRLADEASAKILVGENSSDDSLLGFFARVEAKRLELGDQSAWQQYRVVILGVDSHLLNGRQATIMKPLWQNPDDPNSKEIAEALFGPNGKLTRAGTGGLRIEMFDPTLRVPAFREGVLRALDDRKQVGYVVAGRGQSATAYVGNGGSGLFVDDGNGPKKGERRPYRASDPIAESISHLPGAPKFRGYWTDAKKEPAIKEIKRYFAGIGPKIDQILIDTHAYEFQRD